MPLPWIILFTPLLSAAIIILFTQRWRNLSALISIGAHIRAEMGGDPSTRARHRGARDVEDSRGE